MIESIYLLGAIVTFFLALLINQPSQPIRASKTWYIKIGISFCVYITINIIGFAYLNLLAEYMNFWRIRPLLVFFECFFLSAIINFKNIKLTIYHSFLLFLYKELLGDLIQFYTKYVYGTSFDNISIPNLLVSTMIVYFVLFLFVYLMIKKKKHIDVLNPPQMTIEYLKYFSASIVVLWLLKALNTFFARSSMGYDIIVFFQIVVAILTLVVNREQLFQQEKNILRNNYEMAQKQYEIRKKQYAMQNESFEEINEKYHDLKHFLSYLESRGDKSANEVICKIKGIEEKMIPIFKTGNEVLNMVLSEKYVMAQKNNIKMITNIESKHLLDFMKDIDLYTMFSNAIDNAIEYLKKKDKTSIKTIDIKIYAYNQYTLIKIENPLYDQLIFEKGYPITTQDNHYNHGKGLYSISRTAREYNGNIEIKTDSHSFILNILLMNPLDN